MTRRSRLRMKKIKIKGDKLATKAANGMLGVKSLGFAAKYKPSTLNLNPGAEYQVHG